MIKKIFKKLVNYICYFIVFVVLSTIAYGLVNTSKQKEATAELIPVNRNFYCLNHAWDEEIQILVDEVDTLPKSIQDAFYNGQWIVCINDSIDDTYANKTASKPKDGQGYMVNGITINSSRLICIAKGQDDDMRDTFLHEMGHMINYEYGDICEKKDFRKLYEKYKETYSVSDYIKSSRQEFFAEMFKEYRVNTDKLKDEAPELYEYYNNLMKTEIPDDTLIEKVKMRPAASIRTFISVCEQLIDNNLK